VTTRPDRSPPSKLRFVATCTRGVEDVLVGELQGILGGDVRLTADRGAVRWRGDLESGYRACLWSRVASRVLLVVRRFECRDARDLYTGVDSVDWLVHLEPDSTFAVDFVGVSDSIRNSQFGAMKVKDAIVDQIRNRTGNRPSVDLGRPHVRINLHLRTDGATIAIDLSGAPLHRRGHGRVGGEAPLKENLAAAILLMSNWPELAEAGAPLVDPMCGSGTFLIEGAGIALDRAPGLRRVNWGFTNWPPHQPAIWRKLIAEAEERWVAAADRPVTLIGGDHDPKMVSLTEQNAERAEVSLTVREEELDDSWPPEEQREEPPRGLLVTNPPYGERLGDDESAKEVGRLLGQVLRRRYLGWFAVVLAGSRPLAGGIGLKARKHVLFNGPIECRLMGIDISDKPVAGAGPGWHRPRPEGELSESSRQLLGAAWDRRNRVPRVATEAELRALIDLYADEPVDLENAFDDLAERGWLAEEEGSWTLTEVGVPVARRVGRELRKEAFGSTLVRAAASPTFIEFCRRVNGGDGFSFNMVDEPQRAKLLEVMELSPVESFVDLGCAVGSITEWISDQTGAQGVGIDFAPPAVDLALRTDAAKAGRVEFVVGDLNHLTLPPASFDVAVSIDTLYFVEDVQKAVADILALLCPGGRFAAFYSVKRTEEEPESKLDPHHTDLAKAFQALGVDYEFAEFTDNARGIWTRAKDAAADLKEAWEAEGNAVLWKSRDRETTSILPVHLAGRAARYLYWVRRGDTA
jgi:23S rRNA G2445 N2-methylase RlmL/SAM-dependent methyltransferase